MTLSGFPHALLGFADRENSLLSTQILIARRATERAAHAGESTAETSHV